MQILRDWVRTVVIQHYSGKPTQHIQKHGINMDHGYLIHSKHSDTPIYWCLQHFSQNSHTKQDMIEKQHTGETVTAEQPLVQHNGLVKKQTPFLSCLNSPFEAKRPPSHAPQSMHTARFPWYNIFLWPIAKIHDLLLHLQKLFLQQVHECNCPNPFVTFPSILGLLRTTKQRNMTRGRQRKDKRKKREDKTWTEGTKKLFFVKLLFIPLTHHYRGSLTQGSCCLPVIAI